MVEPILGGRPEFGWSQLRKQIHMVVVALAEPGSAGCIDLTDRMEGFTKWLENNKKRCSTKSRILKAEI